MTRQEFAIKIDNITVLPLDISKIRMKDRIRMEMGEIEQLAQSITKEGLLQPIGVYPLDIPDGEFTHDLAFGGRRFTAIQLIAKKTGHLQVSARIFDHHLNELELKSFEFAENFYRKDLTWQEEIKLKDQIHTLQLKIHGAKHSTAQDAPGWSMNDTAKLINKSKATVSQDLSLANMMKEMPQIDWSKFESKNDAQKALKKARESVITTINADKVEKQLGTGDSKVKIIMDAYRVGDFFEIAKTYGDSTMDLMEIDPPYAIKLEQQKKGYNYTGYNEISPEEYPAFMQRVFLNAYRLLKSNSWMICWFGPEPWFEDMYKWIIKAGFTTNRMVGIWAKGKEEADGSVTHASGQTNNPQYALANGYEMFYIARKGSPMVNKQGTSNLFGESPVAVGQKTHPTERPVPLIERIITTLVPPGSNICVPFAGSGNTLIAAYKNQMIAVGSDLTKEYKDNYIIKVNKEFS